LLPCCITTRLASQARRRDVSAAGCIRVRQHRSVDMDHDLISLVRRAGTDAVVQGRLGEQPQGIRLLLRDGGRFL
jgi:hypothetical protein